MRAQLIERPPAGGEELVEMGRDLRFGQMEPEVEIVNEQEIDTIHAEPHLRLFIGPHDPVVAVVMHVIETEAACPGLGLELVRLGRREEPAPDFGRENEFRPRLRVKETAATNLRQTPTVIGRGVVITNAGVPGRFQRGGGRCFVDSNEELAQRRAAETELRELYPGLPELSRFEGIHKRPTSQLAALRQRLEAAERGLVREVLETPVGQVHHRRFRRKTARRRSDFPPDRVGRRNRAVPG